MRLRRDGPAPRERRRLLRFEGADEQRDLPDEAVLDILAWCRHFARNEDALWRLSQLEERIVRPGVASVACHVAEVVLEPWLDAASSPSPRLRTMSRGSSPP